MGLGLDSISMTNQLASIKKGETNPATGLPGYFAHCLGVSRPASGLLAFGKLELPDGVQWTPLLRNLWSGVSARATNWYRAETISIKIGKTTVKEKKKVY